MKRITLPDASFEIRPIREEDLAAVLNVYQQCEDFLALGPVSTPSLNMVREDVALSQREGGIFCGIYGGDGEMIGVIDYIPSHVDRDHQFAYLSLLLIAVPFRKQGIGKAVVKALENRIRTDGPLRAILSAVQVNNPLGLQFWQSNGFRIVSGPELQPDQTAVFNLRKDFS